jgi:hypothetical protein
MRWCLSLFGLAAALVASAASAAVPSPDVDTIIARSIVARGGAERMHAIKSLMFEHGRYAEGDHYADANATMMLMRPYYKVVGYPGQSKDFLEGYDGAAWEWYADPGIVLHTTGAPSKAARHFADVDGPLLDYKAKGYTASLLGTQVIAGRPAYDVRIAMPDDYESDNFIDQKTYQVIATAQTAKVHAFGAEVTSRTQYSDFRPVAGVLFPFKSAEVEIATGKELGSMQWGSITANREIPVSWFSAPVYEHTPIQTFIEQLYGQREDPSAVMWTYRIFRLAHPGLDTSDAAETAGYQILKMDQMNTAIMLLERNARDYPNVADAAFGLGRAYAAAGRKAEARTEFEQALKINPKHERAIAALKALDTPGATPK